MARLSIQLSNNLMQPELFYLLDLMSNVIFKVAVFRLYSYRFRLCVIPKQFMLKGIFNLWCVTPVTIGNLVLFRHPCSPSTPATHLFFGQDSRIRTDVLSYPRRALDRILSYTLIINWSSTTDSNCRHSAPKADVLPD